MLAALLAQHRVVIAETYPAEAMRHLGLRMAGSKRRQVDRAGLADGLRAAMARLGARGDVGIDGGFGADAAGEDRFDSVLGLLCVLQVLAGLRPDFVPDDPWIRRWEGWVLGPNSFAVGPRGGCRWRVGCINRRSLWSTNMKRRTILAGAAGSLLTSALARPALAQNRSLRTLKFIPEGNLANADPIWTTTTVARNHGFMIYDTLFGVGFGAQAAAADGGSLRHLRR